MVHRTGPETDLPAHKDHSAEAETPCNSVSSIQAPISLEFLSLHKPLPFAASSRNDASRPQDSARSPNSSQGNNSV